MVIPMNLRKILTFFGLDLSHRLHHLEVQIMALNDATARLAASIDTLGTDVTSQLDAISAEIKQLADTVAAGDTSGLEAQLNALADKVDGISTQVTDSTSQLTADDPAAPPAK